MKYFKNLTEGSLLDPSNDGVSSDPEEDKLKTSLKMRIHSRMGRLFAPSIPGTNDGILAEKPNKNNEKR